MRDWCHRKGPNIVSICEFCCWTSNAIVFSRRQMTAWNFAIFQCNATETYVKNGNDDEEKIWQMIGGRENIGRTKGVGKRRGAEWLGRSEGRKYESEKGREKQRKGEKGLEMWKSSAIYENFNIFLLHFVICLKMSSIFLVALLCYSQSRLCIHIRSTAND